MRILNNSSKLLSNMIDSILDLQSIEHGKISLKPARFNIHDLASEMDEIFKF